MKNNTQIIDKIIKGFAYKEGKEYKTGIRDTDRFSGYVLKETITKAISKIDIEHKKDVLKTKDDCNSAWSKQVKEDSIEWNKKIEREAKEIFDELEKKVLVKGLQMYNQDKFDKLKQKHTEGK